MPIYLNGQKCIGAFQNGQRINGYVNGQSIFNYLVTVTVHLVNPWTETTCSANGTTLHFPEQYDRDMYQTLYNVPITVHAFKDLYDYGLVIPYGYNTTDQNDNAYINIADGNTDVMNYIFPKFYTISYNYYNTHQSYKPYENSPAGSTNGTIGIGYGCSFNLDEIINDLNHANYGAGGWSEDVAVGNGDNHTVIGDAFYQFGLYPTNDF